jgi:polysaccharide chain length determinant protein (PEP-CTERM system associated)
MLELNEEKTTTNSKDTLDLLRRRRWWFLLPLFLGWVLTWGLARVLPARYESKAIILVSQQSVPEGYVAQNVQIDMAERMQNVTMEILSRAQLQRIIDQYNLYPDLRDQAASGKQANRMREDIGVDVLPVDDLAQSASPEDPATAAKRALIGQGGKVPDTVAFKISYSARDPHLAQSVAKNLAELFIQENVQERQQKSEATTGFLSQQLDATQKDLLGQAKRIQAFKSQHLGELPEQMSSNVQFMAGLQVRLQAANDAMARAEQQQLYLKSQEAQYQTLGGDLDHGDSSVASSLAAVNKELETLKGKLASLNGAHSDRYPDVQSLRQEIAQDENQKTQLEAQLAAGTGERSTAKPSLPHPTSLSELQVMSPILQVESQLKSNQREIDHYRANVTALEARIEEDQKRINKAPLLELQLAELTRQYDRSKAAYEELAAKANASELATNLGRQGEGGRFTVLSHPDSPKQPAFPNRGLFSLIGLAVGIVLGLAIAGVAELSDDRIHSDNEVTRIVRASLLASIPPISTPEEERRKRVQLGCEYAGAALLTVVMVAGTVFSFLY